MSLPRLLVSIMVLKSKPQDIKYNLNQLSLVVLLYLFSGVLVLSNSIEIDTAVYSMVLDAAVLASFTAGCLMLLQLKARLVQTFVALFGTGVIYHGLAWPMIEALSKSDLTDDNKATLSLMFLMLLSWQILVNAHIYKHALSVDMTKAVLLSVACWLMSMTLSQIIFPVA